MGVLCPPILLKFYQKHSGVPWNQIYMHGLIAVQRGLAVIANGFGSFQILVVGYVMDSNAASESAESVRYLC